MHKVYPKTFSSCARLSRENGLGRVSCTWATLTIVTAKFCLYRDWTALSFSLLIWRNPWYLVCFFLAFLLLHFIPTLFVLSEIPVCSWRGVVMCQGPAWPPCFSDLDFTVVLMSGSILLNLVTVTLNTLRIPSRALTLRPGPIKSKQAIID